MPQMKKGKNANRLLPPRVRLPQLDSLRVRLHHREKQQAELSTSPCVRRQPELQRTP